MHEYDLIVIGGGPAGLFGAISSKDDSMRVLLLEKNANPGKKLLMSGARQCNFTHSGEIKEFLSHYGENGNFLKRALYRFTNQNLIEFFRVRGLDYVETPEGKIFPATMNAKDVLNILLEECKKKRIDILCNKAVKRIDKYNDMFCIYTSNEKYRGRYIIIATGGMSYPSTGSSGDGYILAQNLGHSISKPMPALTPIYIESHPFRDLSGISFQGIYVSLWRGGKKIRNWSGDLLFTHNGISGPGILNYSRYIKPGDTVKLNFVSIEDETEFRREFINLLQEHGKAHLKNILKKYAVPERLIQKLMTLADVSEKERCAHLNKEKRNRLIELLCAFPLKVERLGDFRIAMVTRGGVSLKEVNASTMESRLVPRVFFTGEILDIDGDTGGYNLQAAFSTGWLAGRSIAERMNF